MFDFLKQQGVSESILREVRMFRNSQALDPVCPVPVTEPSVRYYGGQVWEEAVCALLSGENLLLTGPKATGKNILAENLAFLFGRPLWNVSFHIDMDASYLIGTDTYDGNKVVFRPGPVWNAAAYGGFGVLDEINMARNEALAVLHASLDHRRMIDVPGYDSLKLHPAARFIATMNYGYAGTRELNEALCSRFAVLEMPFIGDEDLMRLVQENFPEIRKQAVKPFLQLFRDLELKARNGEITSRAVDLRGLLDAMRLMSHGLSVRSALEMGIVGKTFDTFEKTIIRDCIAAHISRHARPADLFGG